MRTAVSLGIWASPIQEPNDHDDCEESKTKIKNNKRVVSQESSPGRQTEEHTARSSQLWHTWVRPVHASIIPRNLGKSRRNVCPHRNFPSSADLILAFAAFALKSNSFSVSLKYCPPLLSFKHNNFKKRLCFDPQHLKEAYHSACRFIKSFRI